MSKEKVYFDHNDLDALAGSIAIDIRKKEDGDGQPIRLYGVPRGGIPAAYLVGAELQACGIPVIWVNDPAECDYIIDDIIDSGATRDYHAYLNKPFFALVSKEKAAGRWVVFPWEVGRADQSATDIPTRLLQYIGEDVTREGLAETPRRFLKAWEEYTCGYKQDPKQVLKTFDDGAELCSDEIILVSNLQVWSKCEHHASDIFGIAHIGYIPNKKIVGLSKFQRLVDVYGRRLQVQERLTNQIANALIEHVEPVAVGVVLECRHLCMESRGIGTRGAVTVTSALRGAFKDKPEARAEFLSLVRGASRGVQI